MTNPTPPRRTDTREHVLRLLRQSGADMTVADIATRLKLHPNTVRFHLDTLTEQGLVQRTATAPDGPGRPALKVRATAVMDPHGPRHYQELAGALAGALADTPESAGLARRAGQSWADQILAEREASPAATAESVLMDVLDAASFAPERIGDGKIGLRNCPFLEIVDSVGQMVCSVHLGLMRRTLAALGSDRDVLRLDPFVEPGLCVADLSEVSRKG